MANPSKAKGTRFEVAVCDYLVGQGHVTIERRALAGSQDRGDLCNVGSFVVECKNEKRIDLAGYMNEVATECLNADSDYGVAIVKRRGANVKHSYVVMPLYEFSALLHDLKDREP